MIDINDDAPSCFELMKEINVNGAIAQAQTAWTSDAEAMTEAEHADMHHTMALFMNDPKIVPAGVVPGGSIDCQTPSVNLQGNDTDRVEKLSDEVRRNSLQECSSDHV